MLDKIYMEASHCFVEILCLHDELLHWSFEALLWLILMRLLSWSKDLWIYLKGILDDLRPLLIYCRECDRICPLCRLFILSIPLKAPTSSILHRIVFATKCPIAPNSNDQISKVFIFLSLFITFVPNLIYNKLIIFSVSGSRLISLFLDFLKLLKIKRFRDSCTSPPPSLRSCTQLF